MKKIKEVIIVEGKYDKIKIDSLVDALVIPCDGFAIFKQKAKMELLKELAEKRGIIILTDSDSAGQLIRSHIRGCIDNKYIKNAYVPEILGKEKRKKKFAKEGKLGVEGMSAQIILDALKSATLEDKAEGDITNYLLYELGLYGKDNSSNLRKQLLKELRLPTNLSKKALIEVLNIKFTAKELSDTVKKL